MSYLNPPHENVIERLCAADTALDVAGDMNRDGQSEPCYKQCFMAGGLIYGCIDLLKSDAVYFSAMQRSHVRSMQRLCNEITSRLHRVNVNAGGRPLPTTSKRQIKIDEIGTNVDRLRALLIEAEATIAKRETDDKKAAEDAAVELVEKETAAKAVVEVPCITIFDIIGKLSKSGREMFFMILDDLTKTTVQAVGGKMFLDSLRSDLFAKLGDLSVFIGTLNALEAFGVIERNGSGSCRTISLSDWALRQLEIIKQQKLEWPSYQVAAKPVRSGKANTTTKAPSIDLPIGSTYTSANGIECTVTAAGFVVNGETFKSISAAASHVNGRRTSGPQFFRVNVITTTTTNA